MLVFLCDYQVCTFSLSASTTFVYQWSGYSSNWDACFFWNVNLLTWQCFSAEMSVRATSLGAWGKFRLNWPDTQVFYFYEWSFGRCGQISNHVRTLLSAPSYWSSMPESAGFFLNCRRHGTVAVNCKLHGASICPHKWWSYVGQSECGNDASAPCGKAFGFMLLEFEPVCKHIIKCIGIEETILDMSKTCAFPTWMCLMFYFIW